MNNSAVKDTNSIANHNINRLVCLCLLAVKDTNSIANHNINAAG